MRICLWLVPSLNSTSPSVNNSVTFNLSVSSITIDAAAVPTAVAARLVPPAATAAAAVAARLAPLATAVVAAVAARLAPPVTTATAAPAAILAPVLTTFSPVSWDWLYFLTLVVMSF